MSNRKYYVFCEDNCKFESMTKEQIIAAISEATGNTPTGIDEAFITKIKEQNTQGNIKFWVGTQAEYNALTQKNSDTIYYTIDDTYREDIEAALNGKSDIGHQHDAATEKTPGFLIPDEKTKLNKLGAVLWEGDNVIPGKWLTIPGIHNYNCIMATFTVNSPPVNFLYQSGGVIIPRVSDEDMDEEYFKAIDFNIGTHAAPKYASFEARINTDQIYLSTLKFHEGSETESNALHLRKIIGLF